jgi:nucleoside-diphosphate-sugar epimerase
MLEYVSRQYGTPVCLLRLNYAVDLRYGVLVDIGRKMMAGEPIDLSVPLVNCVWQGYANAVALGAFAVTGSPAEILNVTGAEQCRVRELAERLGERLDVVPQFSGREGTSALISDAARCHRLFGPPEVDLEHLLDLVAGWLRAGGRTLDKPTKFHVRDGRF